MYTMGGKISDRNKIGIRKWWGLTGAEEPVKGVEGKEAGARLKSLFTLCYRLFLDEDGEPWNNFKHSGDMIIFVLENRFGMDESVLGENGSKENS